jgi:hypothetical protein
MADWIDNLFFFAYIFLSAMKNKAKFSRLQWSKTHLLPLLGLVISFLFSCSNAKPEIRYGFISLVQYQGETGPYERFSFFIIPEDDDGIENLDELYLYNDREQLRWEIKSGEWETYTANNTTWIGTRGIALQDNQKLPRGRYRAVLVNSGGEIAERSFTFDGEARFQFPSLEITEGRYTVASTWPKNRLVCYDIGGNYITTVELPSLSGTVSSLGIASNVASAALWAEDPESFISAFTNAAPVR